MVYLRLIGDLHGRLEFYFRAARESSYTFQVGDFGSSRTYKKLSLLDPNHHKFIGGNHDDYTLFKSDKDVDQVDLAAGPYTVVGPNKYGFIEKHPFYLDEMGEEPQLYEFSNMPPHYLGNYGIWKIGKKSIFYVRGAWSIDGAILRSRYPDDWFPREQISLAEAEDCLKLYEETKPDFVVTHTCPMSLLPDLHLPISGGRVIPTMTGRFLDVLFEVHKPKFWVFGHFHQYWESVVESCHFICLDKFRPIPYWWDLDYGIINNKWFVDFDEEFNLVVS